MANENPPRSPQAYAPASASLPADVDPTDTAFLVTLRSARALVVWTSSCTGDCGGSRRVTVDELIEDLVAAVNRALSGCG